MNAFDGLISKQFKKLHVDAITEVLRGCGIPCRLIYGTTKYEHCPNCIWDAIGKRSSGKYKFGGPTEFSFGVCPVCNGLGLIPNDTTNEIILCPVYDFKKWIPAINANVGSPEGYVQTISKFETFGEIRQAKEIIINTDIESIVRCRFEREGGPEPCGIGGADFVITMWKRIENG